MECKKRTGKVILSENYSTCKSAILYLLPNASEELLICDPATRSSLMSWFKRVFLPQGYPNSVSSDYVTYQIWDTAQAFCSTITGILATQEVLRSVGVGDSDATPLAATVTWVLKDVCGHVGHILFAFSHGTSLDAFSKTWRLYADTLNDAAMCVELALPYFRQYSHIALCASTVMKAVVGVAGGATRAAMTQHLAIRNNMADVTAKDSAQETAVNLIASMTALCIMTLFKNNYFPIFAITMILHIVFNYFAVRSLKLKVLNEPRFVQVMEKFLYKDIVPDPNEISNSEPIVSNYNNVLAKANIFKIIMGKSIKNAIKKNPKASALTSIVEVFNNTQYMVLPNLSSMSMFVLLKKEASAEDIIRGYFHATLLSTIVCALNSKTSNNYEEIKGNPRSFARVCQFLESSRWSRVLSVGTNFDFEPTIATMEYVYKLVENEWPELRRRLNDQGWDTNKHLLIVDEWRVTHDKVGTSEDSSFTNITITNPTMDDKYENQREKVFTIECITRGIQRRNVLRNKHQ